MLDIVDPFKPAAPAAPASGIVDPFVAPPSTDAIAAFDAARQKAPPAPARYNLTDIPKEVVSGALQGTGAAVSGIGSLGQLIARPIVAGVNAAAGGEVLPAPVNAFEPIGGGIASLGQRVAASESPAAQEAKAKPIITGDISDLSSIGLGEGAKSPMALALGAAGLAGQAIPLLAGGLEGRAARLAPEIAERVPAVMAKLASGEALSGGETAVAQAATDAAKSAARRSLATGAGIGGLQGAQSSAEGERQRIEQMPAADLAALPGYQSRITSGMTPDQARADLADKSAQSTFAATLPASTAMGIASVAPLLHETQGVLSRIAGKSVAQRALVGAAAEAPIQGALAVGQGASGIAGANLVTGENRSPTEGSASYAATGALLGAGFGAFGGIASTPKVEPKARATETAPGAAETITPQPGTAPPAAPTGPLEGGASVLPAVPAGGMPLIKGEGRAPAAPLQPPAAPWINAETGEITKPSDNEIKDQFHKMFESAAEAGAGVQRTAASRMLADEWQVPRDRLITLRKEALAERNAGFKSGDERPATGPEVTADEAQGEGVRAAKVDDTAAAEHDQGEVGRPVPTGAETPDGAQAAKTEEAKGEDHAIETGRQPLDSQREHPPGDQSGQAAEASGGDLAGRSAADQHAAAEEAKPEAVAAEPPAAQELPPIVKGQRESKALLAERAKQIMGAREEATPEAGTGDADQVRQQHLDDIAKQHFTALRSEIGWDTRGGKMIRGADTGESAGGLPPVVGRTSWVGKPGPNGESGFWRQRPVKLNEAQANAAFDKEAAGTALSKRETQFIEYAKKTAKDYANDEVEAAQLASGHSDVQRADAMQRLQDEHSVKVNAEDHNEALSLVDLAQRAKTAGLPDAAVHSFAGEAPEDYAARLWRGIKERSAERGTDTEAAAANRQGGAEVNGQREAAAAAGEKPSPAATEKGPALELASQEAPAAKPEKPIPQTGDLLGAATPREHVEAAARAKEAELAGGGKVTPTMRQGEGELFAGKRPEQAKIPEFKTRKLGDAEYVADENDKPRSFKDRAAAEEFAAKVGGQAEPNEGKDGTFSVRMDKGEPSPTADPRDLPLPLEGAGKEATPITDIGEKIGGARKDLSGGVSERAPRPKSEDERPTWAKRFEVGQITKSTKPGEEGRWSIQDTAKKDFMGRPRDVGRGTTFETKEAAEKAVPLYALALKHRVTETKDGKFGIARDVTDRKRVILKDGFASREEAMQHMADHAKELIEQKTSVGEEALPKPETVGREGPPKRTGDVEPKKFADDFGFRGVEFGNWNNQAERQEVMNHAYDGLHDLSELLGIPAKAISLNGELGLAFGARGHGLSSARAHYERDYAVMNLTKMQGAGALAHEWFHALDHYLGRQDTKASSEKIKNARGDTVFKDGGREESYLSHGYSPKSGIRPELLEAYKELIQTMHTKAETFVRDTEQAEKFVGTTRENLAKSLDDIRQNLAKDRQYGAKKKAASAEQLLEFDNITQGLVSGEDLATAWQLDPKSKSRMGGYRWTNDKLERLSAIMKEVTGRGGFNKEGGALDRVRQEMKHYQQRLTLLDAAKKGTPGEKRTSTEFKMHAVRADQGRGTNYWSTPHEMAARAFSSYVEDKLAEQHRSSDFLSYGSKPNFVLPIPEYPRPFPGGAERVAIDKAFDKFFKTVQAKETEGGKVGLFRQGGEDASGKYSELRSRISEVTSKWGENAPNVRVVDSPEQLPASAKENPRYREAQGFYDGENAYIVASNQKSTAAALSTLAHEVIGHHGIEAILNEHVPGGWDRLSGDIDRLRTEKLGSPAMQAVLRDVARRYPDADKTTFARETLAVMAERGVKNGITGRAIAAVRAFLRKLMPSLKFNESDLRAMLGHSEKYITAGAGKERVPVSGHAFDKGADPFYSALHESVQGMKGAPKVADGTAWKQWLDGAQRRGEFKGAEREWMGLDQYLSSLKGKVTREQLQQFVRDNRVDLREKTLGGDAAAEAAVQRQLQASQHTSALAQRVLHEIDDKLWSGGVVDQEFSGASPIFHQVPMYDRVRVMDELKENPHFTPEMEKLTRDYWKAQDDERAAIAETSAASKERPQFGQYTLPGGENYREMLLTLPDGGRPVAPEPEKITKLPEGFNLIHDAHAAPGEKWGVTPPGQTHGRPFAGRWDSPDVATQAAIRMLNAQALERHRVDVAEQDGRFRGGHFDDVAPNVLAHVRMNDRVGPNGEKILHVEEVQSDWHQKGRREGYNTGPKELDESTLHGPARVEDGTVSSLFNEHAAGETLEQFIAGRNESLAARGDKPITEDTPARATYAGDKQLSLITDKESIKNYGDANTHRMKLQENINASNRQTRHIHERAQAAAQGGVPDAPFKKEWPLLAMKRVLREAAEKGYDKVTWTKGEQQAERYDLSKRIKNLQLTDRVSGGVGRPDMSEGPFESGRLLAHDHDGNTVIDKQVGSPGELASIIGKEAAEKLLALPGKESTRAGMGIRMRELANADLKVGGEGMKAFYDKMLPNEVGKYVKQWGGKVGETAVENHDVSKFDIVNTGSRWQLIERESGERVPNSPAFKSGADAEEWVRDNWGQESGAMQLHSVDITPAMRGSILQGQPMFDLRDAARAGLTRGELKDQGAIADAAKEWRENGTKSPYFQKFFEGSQVEKGGKPTVVYHGTASDHTVFKDTALGDATGHSTSPLGHFFTENKALADRYAENASEGRPSDQRVVDAYLAVKKPYDMSLAEAQSIESQGEARALKARLMKEGFDGIHIAEAKAWVAFDSNQIKSVENRGTFDAKHGDINFSLPAASMDTLGAVLAKPDETVFDRAKAWMRGKAEDLRPAALGALQTRHVLELMEHHDALKGAKQYGEQMQALASDRQQLMAGAPDAAEHPKDMLKRGGATISEALQNFTRVKGPAGWLGAKTEEGKRLADVMHTATVYGIDPSEPYQRLTIDDSRGGSAEWTQKGIKERIKEIRGQMRGRPGDDKTLMMDEVKRLRNIPRRENLRQQRWPELVAKYQSLPEEGKRLYQQQRDWHSQMSDETEKGIINRIEALGHDIGKNYVRSLQDRIRLQFETQRNEGVYFPLNRDGDYWASFTDKNGQQGFKMFESAKEAVQAEKKLRAAGFKVDAQGRRDSAYKAKDAPSGTFVKDVVQLLAKAGASEKVQDDVYQMFLKTLPEMSMRKHAIHRQNIPGFSEDITRAFAKNAFHGAHQLSRLRHAFEMQSTIEAMQSSLDNYRQGEFGEASKSSALNVARGDALLQELRKRHDYIMSPKDTQLSNVANSIGFLYYLGASPASAIVNLTQNAQITLPVLGAHHGWDKASGALSSAMRDSLRTFGNIDRTLTDPEERQAFNVLRTRGDIDKSQAHTLAGIAEGSLLSTNPVWSKAMSGMTYMFHKAEVINREAAGMAAFRLAKKRGDSFQDAVQYASDIINGTHFDYSAANRPRYMQGNAARVALQFKNYSLGMTWAVYRNAWQAFKGETPEIRRVALKSLTGILGTTALMAGSMGLPMYNYLKYAGNAAHALFGDDEPWDFDTEYRGFLADHLGQDAAKWVADGAVNRLGAQIATRVSLSDMWFREPDKELEGKDAYYAYLDTIAGPLGGMVKNFFVGSKMVGDGNVERGIETMMPKFAKDAMKATRFAHDGANSLRGDPILPDVTGPESFIQAMGFQPTRLFEQQQTNTALKNYEQDILNRRQTLMNAYAMAVRAGDDRDTALEKIHAFNAQYPEIALKAEAIRQSLRARAKYSASSESGIFLNKKIASRVREDVGGQATP